jgi:hypothetical protein
MKKVLLLVGLLAGGVAGLRAQPIPLYENYGNVTFNETAPQIDALAVANYGSFNVVAQNIFGQAIPYDFQNTLYFTNRGSMFGFPGLQFDTAFSDGQRQPALVFENQAGGDITGLPWLSVDAERIVSAGILSSDATGIIRLKGGDVNLSRSGIEIEPFLGGGGGVTDSNFFPDAGIFDLYWGGITNQGINSDTFLQVIPNLGPVVETGIHIITNAGGGIGFTSWGLANPRVVAAYTNQVNSTNWIVQAAFVDLSDTNFSARVRFAPSQIPTNAFRTVVVEVSLTDTNIVTGNLISHNLYLVDRLASDTNWVMLTNLTTLNTFRPATYELTRSTPFEFFTGASGNTPLSSNLFYDASFSNTFVTNAYAAYAAEISGGTASLLPLPGVSITNATGRVEIEGDALDLRRTRIRGNGLISIETDHLVGSEGAEIDCGDLTFKLASTNGVLRIQDLSKELVVRMNGAMRAWSGVWSNTTAITETQGTNTVTNVVTIGFHALLLDMTFLDSLQQVQVHDVTATSTNVFFHDDMLVTERFEVNAESMTVDAGLTLAGGVQRLAATNLIGIGSLTNLGTISVPNTVFLGSDRPTPYRSVVNRGTLSAAGQRIRSEYFENAGTLAASGPLIFEVLSGKFEGGRSSAGGDVSLAGFDLKLHRYTNTAGGTLLLNATNSLADTGGGAAVLLSCTEGFELLRKPVLGDLLGTTLQTTAPRFASVAHMWSAEDRGAVPAGFQDNVGVGELILSAGAFAELRFRGATPGGTNAMYVDVLNLSGSLLTAFDQNDLESVLVIDPSLTIYFAYANVSPEELDGALNGRLRWVRDFAGPGSGQDLALPSGRVIRVNRGLLESPTIDSDGDGLANAIDPTPFAEPELTLNVVTSDPQVTVLKWAAAPLTTYVVEYSTNPVSGGWQVLASAANPGLSVAVLAVEDHDGGETNRYYRLRYEP